MASKISLCMICRDNEDTIGDILDDAKLAWVDEMCVVDTGSVDRTVEIALSKGATVHHREWRDDFAWAKNQALELATNDWCFIVDSDDRIDKPLELRRFFHNDVHRLPSSCSGMKINVVVGIGPQKFTVTQMRFIRKSSGLRFKYPIHETFNAEGHDVYYLQEVQILHPQPFRESHNERNLRILESWYNRDDFTLLPHDEQQHVRLNLGREYMGIPGHVADVKACDVFADFFKHANAQEQRDYWPNLYYGLATEHPTQRASRLQRAAAVNPYRAEAWVELGLSLLKAGKFKQALKPLENALRCKYPTDGMAYPPDYTWRPLILISVCFNEMGDYERARAFAYHAQRKGCPPELIAETNVA